MLSANSSLFRIPCLPVLLIAVNSSLKPVWKPAFWPISTYLSIVAIASFDLLTKSLNLVLVALIVSRLPLFWEALNSAAKSLYSALKYLFIVSNAFLISSKEICDSLCISSITNDCAESGTGALFSAWVASLYLWDKSTPLINPSRIASNCSSTGLGIVEGIAPNSRVDDAFFCFEAIDWNRVFGIFKLLTFKLMTRLFSELTAFISSIAAFSNLIAAWLSIESAESTKPDTRFKFFVDPILGSSQKSSGITGLGTDSHGSELISLMSRGSGVHIVDGFLALYSWISPPIRCNKVLPVYPIGISCPGFCGRSKDSSIDLFGGNSKGLLYPELIALAITIGSNIPCNDISIKARVIVVTLSSNFCFLVGSTADIPRSIDDIFPMSTLLVFGSILKSLKNTLLPAKSLWTTPIFWIAAPNRPTW